MVSNESTVFISHDSREVECAQTLARDLEDSGVSAWYAPRDIPPGSEWDEAIFDAISSSSLIVVLFGAKSDASINVKREVIIADSHDVPVLPVRIDDIAPRKLAYLFAATQWIDWLDRDYSGLKAVTAAALRYVEPSPRHQGCEHSAGILTKIHAMGIQTCADRDLAEAVKIWIDEHTEARAAASLQAIQLRKFEMLRNSASPETTREWLAARIPHLDQITRVCYEISIDLIHNNIDQLNKSTDPVTEWHRITEEFGAELLKTADHALDVDENTPSDPSTTARPTPSAPETTSANTESARSTGTQDDLISGSREELLRPDTSGSNLLRSPRFHMTDEWKDIEVRHFRDDKKPVRTVRVYRIVAATEFVVRDKLVKVGDLGGWIESATTAKGAARLSGASWVFPGCSVFDEATLSGQASAGSGIESCDARIYGHAEVSGDARIGGNAWLSGSAIISDRASITGNAQIIRDAQVNGNSIVRDDPLISGGIMTGNVKVIGMARISRGVRDSGTYSKWALLQSRMDDDN